jgi:aspartate racemase
MRTLGLLGGMSWESTLPYYRLLNERVRERLGGLHSAKLLLYSADFAEIEALQHRGEWEAAGELLADAAVRLQHAGAQALLICTNTMHRVAAQVEAATAVPLLHIADATARRIHAAGLQRVGLLGTRFTMEQAFYRERLEQTALQVVVPEASMRERIHAIIYDELCRGVILEESRAFYRQAIATLVGQGVQGVILGCTEIALLVDAGDAEVPLFDTARIHAEDAVDWALADVIG